MNELIKTEIEKIKNDSPNLIATKVNDETAFELLMCKLFCIKEFDNESALQKSYEENTNGSNDGGIDFVHYDDENNKVILGQCKLVTNLTPADLIVELDKMSNTLKDFKKRMTGSYNERLKQTLQNALDTLPEGNEFNIEYHIYVSGKVDIEACNKKIEKQNVDYTTDMVTIFNGDIIASTINDFVSMINTVNTFSITIDKPNNYLEYETGTQSGIMVNLSSKSLIDMYNKYKNNGLFDLNIRKYISNKQVDNGIKKTIDKERENFWFLNNGVIIACKDFEVDGYKVRLSEFSIVNGGQTTNRIGEYKGSNSKEFYIPCKIVSKNSDPGNEFYNKIAEASNSQKPIYPRDLKSNSPEMQKLKNWLNNSGIYLEIKRGEKKSVGKKKIRNDELGQLLLSFVHQQPGTARSGKVHIFDNDSIYNKLYKNNYESDPKKKGFIVDLIELYNKYGVIEKELRYSGDLDKDEVVVLSNGKYIVFAVFGLLYGLANKDITQKYIIDPENRKKMNGDSFIYDSFLSKYRGDDIDKIIRKLIVILVGILSQSYKQNKEIHSLTSVSNYFKTDNKYRELVVKSFVDALRIEFMENQIMDYSKIFQR